MKPNFALSLSFDGIRLLHRAAGGWRLVGDVALDAEDMAGELAVLRKTATLLEPGGLRSKLLLPNDQIKYLTLETPGLSEADRQDAAIQALDGATPYAVADLAFDTSFDGDTTHVAAVARETLAEAEAFAVEHRFHPVCFAAVPGDQPFLGEPFFGQADAAATLLADGETVEPDGIAVVVIGDAALPGESPPAPPTTEATPVTAATDSAGAEPVESQTTDSDATPEPAKPGVSHVEPDDDVPPAPAIAAPTAGFASRRGQKKPAAPQVGAARREPEITNPAAPTVSVSSGHLDIEPDSSSLEPEPAPAAPKAGFLSRRRSKLPGRNKKAKPADTAVAEPQTAETAKPDGSEEERMTIFGARRSDVGGKPRYLGLILTAALLIFLAGVAAWASVFLDDGISLSRIFGPREPKAAFVDPPKVIPTPQTTGQRETVQTVSLDPSLTDEDSAVLDALRAPELPDVLKLTEDELEARYAVSGIWPRAPNVPPDPAGLIDIDDLYLTSIDPVSTANDAIALPAMGSFDTDLTLAAISNPTAAGTKFALDPRGLIIPTPQGALSPDGIVVYLGRPPVVPPATPTRFQSEPEVAENTNILAGFRPRVRPNNLSETNERAQLGGLTRSELAGIRPTLRPKSLQQQAAEVAKPIDTDEAVTEALEAPAEEQPALQNATKYAIAASRRPDTRPRNFSRIVKRAQRNKPKDDAVRVASAATVAPRTVTPKIPSKASVSRQATIKNAINLRKVNLIGVYGKPSSRRALVRLGNGRYKKVVVGDRIDGGRVAAIGDSSLRYTKSGRSLTLKMPN